MASGGEFGVIWRRLLLVIDVLVLLAGCVAVVALYVRPSLYGAYDEARHLLEIQIYGSPTFDLVVIGCAALLLLNLLLLVWWRRPKQPLRTIPSTSVAGTVVRVERGALEAGLRSAAEDLEVVHRARIAIEQDGPKRLRLRAFFQCPEGVTILAASEALRMALDERFAAMVRLPDGMRSVTEIEFVGFSGKMQKAPEPPPEPPADPEPFRGPQYPIEGENGASPAP